jgi:hypothetical protein
MNLIFGLGKTLVDSSLGVFVAHANVMSEYWICYPDELSPELIGPAMREMLINWRMTGLIESYLCSDRSLQTLL